MSVQKSGDSKVTIKIPRNLYNRLSVIVKDSGFNSVTDFVIYVLRDLASTRQIPFTEAGSNGERLTKEEVDAIRKRLQSLGYL
jgi:hypothetical protein